MVDAPANENSEAMITLDEIVRAYADVLSIPDDAKREEAHRDLRARLLSHMNGRANVRGLAIDTDGRLVPHFFE
jgi:hypothetical protein